MNALKQYHEELHTLEAQRAPLVAKMLNTVDPAGDQAEAALTTVAAAESKLRTLRGRQLLGEPVDADIAAIEAELAEARQTAAEHAQTAEAAQAARDILQSQIDDINRRAAKIRADMEAARWEAARAEVSKLADAYRKACEAAEAAYLELIGAAQAADSLRPVESAPRCYSAVAPAVFTFPAQMMMPEFAGFRMTRDLYAHHTRASIEQAAREKFGGILEGAA